MLDMVLEERRALPDLRGQRRCPRHVVLRAVEALAMRARTEAKAVAAVGGQPGKLVQCGPGWHPRHVADSQFSLRVVAPSVRPSHINGNTNFEPAGAGMRALNHSA